MLLCACIAGTNSSSDQGLISLTRRRVCVNLGHVLQDDQFWTCGFNDGTASSKGLHRLNSLPHVKCAQGNSIAQKLTSCTNDNTSAKHLALSKCGHIRTGGIVERTEASAAKPTAKDIEL